MEYRPFYLAKEWIHSGHSVAIVAASFSHVRSKSPDVHDEFTEEMITGIRYIWLKTPVYRGNGVWRALNIFAFVLQLYRFMARIVRTTKPDVVIASSTHPLDMFPARRIATRADALLLFEVHDLWPLSLIELGGMSALHPFVRIIRYAEGFAYRNADHVISMLPNAEEYMKSRGLKVGRFSYIPNGINVSDWLHNSDPLPELHRKAIEHSRNSANLLVGYAGAHGLANALFSILDAAPSLEPDGVIFILVGQGSEKDSLNETARSRGLKNVRFLPPVPRGSLPQLLSAMDVLYIGLQSQPLFRFGISPNKLFDYMMAGKPILQAIRAGNDIVKECACGFTIPPEDSKALVGAIQRLLQMPITEREAMGMRGQSYVMAHHEYRSLASRFLETINFARLDKPPRWGRK